MDGSASTPSNMIDMLSSAFVSGPCWPIYFEIHLLFLVCCGSQGPEIDTFLLESALSAFSKFFLLVYFSVINLINTWAVSVHFWTPEVFPVGLDILVLNSHQEIYFAFSFCSAVSKRKKKKKKNHDICWIIGVEEYTKRVSRVGARWYFASVNTSVYSTYVSNDYALCAFAL